MSHCRNNPNSSYVSWPASGQKSGRNYGSGSTRHRRTSMETTLGIVSLSFGLLATVVLAVSVAADYWLHTTEPYDIGNLVIASIIESKDYAANDANDSLELDGEIGNGVRGGGEGGGGLGLGPSAMGRLITLSTHSGLWKACVTTVNDQFTHHESSSEADEDYEGEEEEGDSCSFIDYFGQGFERIEGGETSIAILRGIRKATPVILVSMALMTISELLSIVGYFRRDCRTIIGGILSIISALSLVLGQIFYISVVNDEVSQWKKPEIAGDGQVFTYGYGWAFYAASSSFLCAMVSAVGQITLFLSRYSGSVRDMVFVVPGLNTKKLATAETPLSAAPGIPASGDFADGLNGTHRQSVIF